MRRPAARAHLWGGLVSGPLLLVRGLSGSPLVCTPDVERLTNGPAGGAHDAGGRLAVTRRDRGRREKTR